MRIPHNGMLKHRASNCSPFRLLLWNAKCSSIGSEWCVSVCEFVYFLWDRFIPNPNQSMHKWLHYLSCTLTQVFYPVRSIEQTRKCICMHVLVYIVFPFLIVFASDSSSFYLFIRSIAFYPLDSDLCISMENISETWATWIRIKKYFIIIYAYSPYIAAISSSLIYFDYDFALSPPLSTYCFDDCNHPHAVFLLYGAVYSIRIYRA